MPMSKTADRIWAARELPILITMGEPAGIGPEIAVAAYTALNGRAGAHPLRLVGDSGVFRACGDVPDHALFPIGVRATRRPGVLEPHNAGAAIEAVRSATEETLSARAAALITAPIHKSALTGAGFAFPGHTEYLAHLTGARRAVMMLASDALRVVPLTIHIPLREVPRRITREAVVESAEITLSALTRDFGIAHPRLAVAGLNPHAGESGTIGREEELLIAPAIAQLRARGHAVLGPLSADTLFHEEARKAYDAALCMYHDQALIPIKTLAFWEGVNVTLGLPIVRTSPDHGTALDIAGSGKADANSMIAAIRMAAAIADARARA
jgi:4-hydroxythreonine-4-phosphate dehydrogenase